jgi:hypothetical protein
MGQTTSLLLATWVAGFVGFGFTACDNLCRHRYVFYHWTIPADTKTVSFNYPQCSLCNTGGCRNYDRPLGNCHVISEILGEVSYHEGGFPACPQPQTPNRYTEADLSNPPFLTQSREFASVCIP